ncbi:MAG: hypothetical protein J6Y94_05690, partial [Bacteriovoracaceae bacterium]|nr:hypothetical protein [Bacteriovoracaceae bacterium]
MSVANFGLWPLVVFLSLWAIGALQGLSLRRTALLLGLVGAGLSLYYYHLETSFWPLIYFLVYLIVFAAWLMMALTFPAAALRDDALHPQTITSSAFMALKSKWPWRRLLKYLLAILLAIFLAISGLALAQTLVILPELSFTSLAREDYFIDL